MSASNEVHLRILNKRELRLSLQSESGEQVIELKIVQ